MIKTKIVALESSTEAWEQEDISVSSHQLIERSLTKTMSCEEIAILTIAAIWFVLGEAFVWYVEAGAKITQAECLEPS